MTPQAAQKPTHPTPSLDALYALVQSDLKRVDALILARAKSQVPLIDGIAEHIIASGGKRIRPALTLISSQLCGAKGDEPVALAAAIEFIHTATLLHDDVVDESKLRRGLATNCSAIRRACSWAIFCSPRHFSLWSITAR